MAPSPIHSPAQLGRRLRDARRSRGLTQTQLSDLSGITQATISQIERAKTPVGGHGKGRPAGTSLGTLLKLLACLDLEMVVQPRPVIDAAAAWDE